MNMIEKDKVNQNLAFAFAEESKAAVRNEAYALKADEEGYPQIARLFRAMANADSVHARRFLLLMRGKIGTTRENLKAAFEREQKAKTTHYPGMVEEAKDSSKAIKKAFAQSMKTDGEHADLYLRAMEDNMQGKEVIYYVCQICGHIQEGFVPENCPVCKAVPGRFRKAV